MKLLLIPILLIFFGCSNNNKETESKPTEEPTQATRPIEEILAENCPIDTPLVKKHVQRCFPGYSFVKARRIVCDGGTELTISKDNQVFTWQLMYNSNEVETAIQVDTSYNPILYIYNDFDVNAAYRILTHAKDLTPVGNDFEPVSITFGKGVRSDGLWWVNLSYRETRREQSSRVMDRVYYLDHNYQIVRTEQP